MLFTGWSIQRHFLHGICISVGSSPVFSNSVLFLTQSFHLIFHENFSKALVDGSLEFLGQTFFFPCLRAKEEDCFNIGVKDSKFCSPWDNMGGPHSGLNDPYFDILI